MIVDLILTVAIIGSLSIPGILSYRLMFPREKREDALINGITWGLVIAVTLIHLCSTIHLMLALAPLGLGTMALGYAKSRTRAPTPRTCRARKRGWGALILLAAIIVISRSIPLMLHELPRGYDPKFNLVLADKALQLQRSFVDWEPFYSVRLNYPIGSHLLTAFVSTISRVELHRVYGFMVPIFGALLALQLYVFARRTTRSPRLALWASGLFGLVAVYGSIGYGYWNGLPNLLGMNFLLLSLSILMSPQVSRSGVVAFGICFVAIFFTHHHVMITACAIYLGLFILLLSTGGERKKAWGMVGSGVIAMVVGGVYIVPYALRVVKLSSTSVMRFKEPFFGIRLLAESLGYGFGVAVVLGVGLFTYRAITKKQRLHCGWRFAIVVTGVLVVLFIGFSYVYRIYAKAALGHEYVAFTPSRFLTDMTVFLAIFAAYGLARVLSTYPTAVHCTVLLFLAATNYGVWRELAASPPNIPAAPLRAAYRYVRHNTPKDAVILTTEQWAPYCARRRTMHFPLPVSEPVRSLPEYVTAVNRKMGAPAERPPLGYSLLAIGHPKSFRLPHNVLWTHPSGLAVVEVLFSEK